MSRYQELEPLILYLENEIVRNNLKTTTITSDFQDYEAKYKKIDETCLRVEKLLLDGDLIPLLEIDENFPSLRSFTTEETYLATLSEQVLTERYREALKVNHYSPFDHFPKLLKHMYLRMRLNTANSHVFEQKLDPFLEEVKKLRDHINTEIVDAIIER